MLIALAFVAGSLVGWFGRIAYKAPARAIERPWPRQPK